VKVILTGEKATVESITNDAGVYLVVGLPPGKYRVKPLLPDTLSMSERDVVLPAGGCATLDIHTRTDGRVSGKVFDQQGRAIEDAKVRLMPAAKDDDSAVGLYSGFETTDKDGQFEFKELSPGRYYLGINLDQEPQGSFPYPRTYFPGTPDKDKAQIIELGEGEKLTGFNITLPPALVVKTVEGVFLWSDGRPVSPGTLYLAEFEDPKKKGRVYASVGVGAEGRFTLQGFDGVECWLHGSTYAPVGRGMEFVDATPIKIFVTDGMKPIKLIAPIPKDTKKQK
jgi:hypothetical protein